MVGELSPSHPNDASTHRRGTSRGADGRPIAGHADATTGKGAPVWKGDGGGVGMRRGLLDSAARLLYVVRGLALPAAKSGSVHVWLQLLVSELVGGLVSGGVWTSACTTSHVICVLHATTKGRFTCGRSPSACARSIEASGRGMYVPIQGGKPGPPPFIRAARAPLHERMQR